MGCFEKPFPMTGDVLGHPERDKKKTKPRNQLIRCVLKMNLNYQNRLGSTKLKSVSKMTFSVISGSKPINYKKIKFVFKNKL